MLELKHITYTVSTPEGEQTILNDISIDIPDRKLIVFTGPNGGGKTTLAKVIMGLVQPTSGRVLYNGEDVTDLSITERAKRGISYGFQQPPRFKGITVHDLLLLAAVVALGYFTDIVDFTELKAVFSLKLTALLKLAVMVLLVLLVSNLVIFILHGIKPRTHRGGSVLSLLSSPVKYVAGIIIVCQSLSLLGVNVGTIIASVGVLALVVGFSAESLIADVVIGAFMLLETQYNVGDIVEVNGFRGVVTKIGIRTTSITDGGGNVKIINNSEMKNILNRSDNNSWSVSDISIPYETDLEKLEAQLPTLLEEIFRARGDVMLDVPQYLGVQTLDASGIVLRFWVKVAEKNIYAGARALNRELLLGFRRLGVECPFPQMDVHMK